MGPFVVLWFLAVKPSGQLTQIQPHYCLCIETYQLRNLKNDLLHTNEILWVDTFFLSAARNVWRPEWRTSAVWCGHVPQKTRDISTLKAGSFGETPFPSRAVWGTYLENIDEEWWRYWLCNLWESSKTWTMLVLQLFHQVLFPGWISWKSMFVRLSWFIMVCSLILFSAQHWMLAN